MIHNKNPTGLVLCMIGMQSEQTQFETLSFYFYGVDWLVLEECWIGKFKTMIEKGDLVIDLAVSNVPIEEYAT